MNDLQKKIQIQADLKARKLRLKLIKDEYNRLQHLAEELAVANFQDEAKIRELNNKITADTPTLARNYASLLIILLFPLLSFSQAHLDFGGGAGFEKLSYVNEKGQIVNNTFLVPAMKISAGYQIGNIVTEAIMQPSITNHVNRSCYFGFKAGYNFRNIIPQIGYLYNYRNSDDISMNRWQVGYALKYQIKVNDNGGLFAEAMYTASSYSLTAGFNIQF